MIVAIHQPNFFPWLGYFDKIVRSDMFIFLDDAQFPKKGGTWLNRVQLNFQGTAQFFTAPIDRTYHGFRTVSEMVFKDQDWKAKFLTTLQSAYGRAPFFPTCWRTVQDLVTMERTELAEYNRAVILAIVEYLELPRPRFEIASQFECDRVSTGRLVQLVRAAHGRTYLCGGGAGGYQVDEEFTAAGIGLTYQDFQHPTYDQLKGHAFVPGLSILDALFHLGPEGTRTLLLRNKSGFQPTPLKSAC